MLLDTNIVIGHLNAEPSTVKAIARHKNNGEPLIISVVTVTEVLSHGKLSEVEIAVIKEYLNTLIVIPLDAYLAESAAEFRRTYALTAMDAIIVATANLYGMPLATRDKKMQKVKEVTFVEI